MALNYTHGDPVLIVKMRALGDAVLGLSSVQYAKDLFPDAKIIYGTPAWVAPFFQKIECAADEILPLQLKTWKDYYNLWKSLRRLRPKLIHELHAAGRTKRFFTLYSWITRTPYTYHNHHLLQKEGREGILDQGVIKPLIQRDLDGVWSVWHILSYADQSVPSHLLYSPKMTLEDSEKNELKKNKIILGIVATRQAKMWPLGFFAQLVDLINEAHKAFGLSFPQIVVPLSNSIMDTNLERDFKVLNLPGNVEFIKVPLCDLAHALSGAEVYIGNDTGLKHICVALDVPTITLFGPEPPLEWHPYDRSVHSYFFIKEMPCRTRTAHYCGLSECQDHRCMNEISAKEVFQHLSQKEFFKQKLPS